MRAATIVVGLLTVSSVVAEEVADVSRFYACTKFGEDAARLKCFDEAAKRIAPVAKPAIAAESRWNITRSKSELDDSPRILASTPSTMATNSRFPGSDKQASLVLRCVEGTTSVAVIFPNPVVSADARVLSRIGDEPLQRSGWEEADSGTTIGLWSSGASIPVIRAMTKAKGKQFVIGIEAYGAFGTSGAIFILDGVQAAAQAVADACGWILEASPAKPARKSTRKP
jgi:type VI secretion system VasI family protein